MYSFNTTEATKEFFKGKYVTGDEFDKLTSTFVVSENTFPDVLFCGYIRTTKNFILTDSPANEPFIIDCRSTFDNELTSLYDLVMTSLSEVSDLAILTRNHEVISHTHPLLQGAYLYYDKVYIVSVLVIGHDFFQMYPDYLDRSYTLLPVDTLHFEGHPLNTHVLNNFARIKNEQ